MKNYTLLLCLLLPLLSRSQPAPSLPQDTDYMLAHAFQQEGKCSQAKHYYEEFIAAYRGEDKERWVKEARKNMEACREGKVTPLAFQPAAQPAIKEEERPVQPPVVSQPPPPERREAPVTRPPVSPERVSPPSPSTVAGSGSVYKVQFIATSKGKQYPALERLGAVSTEQVPGKDGVYRYFVGAAATLEEAQALLGKVRKAGFERAFVVEYEEEGVRKREIKD